MNNEKITTEYDTVNGIDFMDVTAEQLAAVDALLASVAKEEDAKVDYNGMLRGIKAKALEQGLAAELNRGRGKKAGDKRKKLRRILSIAGSAAAAMVLGIGILGVLSHGPKSAIPNNDGTGDHSAYIDNEQTKAPVATVTAAPATKDPDVIITDEPTQFATDEPVSPTEEITAVDTTPLPTEFAVRGGVRGYTYLGCFETPEELSGLVPDIITDTMLVAPYEQGFGYTAKSNTDGEWRYIDCRIEAADEVSMPEGAAVYTVKDNGAVGFVWRINEKDVMYIDFEGFEYSVAEEILLTFVLKPDTVER